MDSPITTLGPDSYAAVLVAAFSKVEQTILNLALIGLLVFILMIAALLVAMWFERRDRKRNAQLVAAVQARLDKGVLR